MAVIIQKSVADILEEKLATCASLLEWIDVIDEIHAARSNGAITCDERNDLLDYVVNKIDDVKRKHPEQAIAMQSAYYQEGGSTRSEESDDE